MKALAPGAYTVQVTDNCNTTVTRNFTVTGTYAVPSLAITTQSPGCPNSSDGSITINVTNGRAPLTYSLISPSPVIAGPQANNVFTGLPAGTYTCQVTDSCGNFQTRTVGLSATPSSVSFINASVQYVACDSFAVILTFNISNYKPPYTITATLPNGSVVTHVLTAPSLSSGYLKDTFNIRYHHTTGANDQLPITITNQCGVSATGNPTLSSGMDMSPNGNLPSGCANQYTYTFDNYPQLHCGTVTYTLVSPTGTVLATQTNNSTFSGYPTGTGYKVIRQDCCKKDTLVFDWAAGPPFQISYTQNLGYAPCREGMTSLYITYNYGGRLADIVLVSGPPSVTFADGTVHTYTYPDTTTNVWSGSGIGYFGPGTYKIYAVDHCGNKDSVTKTFALTDVRHTAFSASLEKGCTNNNKILLNATSSGWYDAGNVTVNSIYSQHFGTSALSISDSIVSLSAGTYYATYTYQDSYGPAWVGMANPGCDVIKDTIVIPAYTQPAFNPSAAVALCGATRQVALLPDTTTGVSPYQYQIIAGPTTTSVQSSPEFPNLSAGTYTFQMTDACANSYSHSISINNLAVPNVATTGSTCIGGAATFTLPASPFFNYSWQLPNGSTRTGNMLAINPVTSSSIGTYTVSLTSTIGGCTNTISKSYVLNACQVLAETLLHFSGDWKNGNIQLSWQMADETDMSYYIVERSTDGSVFTPVQQAEATGGTLKTYTATDTNVPAGVVYYRLQMVENSGAIHYSSIISFNNANTQSFNVYPSLITGNTPVTVICPVTSHTSFIRVISVDGKVWQTVPIAAGTTKTRIDVTNLARGNYFVVFTGNDNVMATQVWKE
ncbi:hypothetical protein GCM10011511_03130 [Puia dinghuensis]|uniref:T9SS C-terminal target domain-containing protein n=1 Tax=Puia dinghuensis TaxID=1792502 RepID=A0A8J2U7A0_9BACT|nr:hypothetical protein GCM10011511_03130 [Puia dinghuensis]